MRSGADCIRTSIARIARSTGRHPSAKRPGAGYMRIPSKRKACLEPVLPTPGRQKLRETKYMNPLHFSRHGPLRLCIVAALSLA